MYYKDWNKRLDTEKTSASPSASWEKHHISQPNSKSEDDGSDDLRPSPSLKARDLETQGPRAEKMDLGRNLTSPSFSSVLARKRPNDVHPHWWGLSHPLFLNTPLVLSIKLTLELLITVGKQSSMAILKNINKCDHNPWRLLRVLWVLKCSSNYGCLWYPTHTVFLSSATLVNSQILTEVQLEWSYF